MARVQEYKFKRFYEFTQKYIAVYDGNYFEHSKTFICSVLEFWVNFIQRLYGARFSKDTNIVRADLKF